MFTPGILTRSQADALNALMARVNGSSFQMAGPIGQVQSAFGHQSQVSPPRQRWWARITGASGGGYSWTEIQETTAGTWADVSPAWSGTGNAYPLPNDNGTVPVVPTGARVEMWVSAAIPNAFEFKYAGNVCTFGTILSTIRTYPPFCENGLLYTPWQYETWSISQSGCVSVTLGDMQRSQAGCCNCSGSGSGNTVCECSRLYNTVTELCLDISGFVNIPVCCGGGGLYGQPVEATVLNGTYKLTKISSAPAVFSYSCIATDASGKDYGYGFVFAYDLYGSSSTDLPGPGWCPGICAKLYVTLMDERTTADSWFGGEPGSITWCTTDSSQSMSLNSCNPVDVTIVTTNGFAQQDCSPCGTSTGIGVQYPVINAHIYEGVCASPACGSGSGSASGSDIGEPLSVSCSNTPACGYLAFCGVPSTIAFSCTATGGSGGYTYFWSFWDGQTSTSQNPSMTFNSGVSYGYATVYVTDSDGTTASCSVGPVFLG